MKTFKILIAILFIFTGLLLSSFSHADNIVIELLITNQDNELWKPKENMHMTVAHLKDVDYDQVLKKLLKFNKENQELLKKYVTRGFIVKQFTTNGFGDGHHMLEADMDTTKRFDEINKLLYLFFRKKYSMKFSDKTTPKYINPKGYTPHIQFLEQDDKIPLPGVIMHFEHSELLARKQ